MRVLHLDTGREWRGGQQQVLYLTAGLAERGVDSVVAAPEESPLLTHVRQAGLPSISLGAHAQLHPRSLFALQRILKADPCDVLHAHTAKGHTLAFLAQRTLGSRSARGPRLVVSRRVDFMPGKDPFSRYKYLAPGRSFICVSDGVRQVLLRYGVPASALHVVRSGVELPSFDAQGRAERWLALRDELGVPRQGLLIGTIGQLVPHKGQTHLLGALMLLRSDPVAPPWHVVFLGDGPLRKDLDAERVRLGLEDRVTLAGYRPGARRYLEAMDLYVTSSVEEGLGTSTLDAAAAGLPVVATTAGGSAETVDPGATGLLVAPGDAGAIAEALRRLLASSELRAAMGSAGRRWVAERFSSRAMVEGTLAVYQEVLATA